MKFSNSISNYAGYIPASVATPPATLPDALADTGEGSITTPVISSMKDSGYFGRLTDYQRIIVVDGGGNGDYTTLAEALASVTGATARSRYGIFLFGNVAETVDSVCPNHVDILGMPGNRLLYVSGKKFVPSGEITSTNTVRSFYSNLYFVGCLTGVAFAEDSIAKFVNCVFEGSVICAPGSVCFLDGCYGGANFGVSTGGGTVIMSNCGNIQNITCDAGYLAMNACNATIFSTSYTGPLLSITGGRAVIHSCSFDNSAYTGDTPEPIVYLETGALEIYNCTVLASVSANMPALYITEGETIFAASSTFKANSGYAVVGNAPMTNVPLMHCVFDGGVTNVSCKAGTADGTSVTV